MTAVTLPRRHQRSRARGWRMPEGAVYVGRPTKWGNPFEVGAPYFVMDLAAFRRGDSLATAEWHRYTAADAVEAYRRWFGEQVGKSGFSLAAEAKEELAGRDLVCWCPAGQPCHADVLLEITKPPEVTR